MRKLTLQALAVAAVVLLSACGGGGGSAGATKGTPTSTTTGTTGTTGTTATTPATATLTTTLVDDQANVVADRTLSQTKALNFAVTVKDALGAAVPYALVKVSATEGASLVRLNQLSALTDAAGVAKFPVSPQSVTSQGAITLVATSTVKSADVTNSLNVQVSTGNVVLSNLQLDPPIVQKGQSVGATVDVLVNGVKAASNSVSVAFASTCGVVSPAASLVDGNGQATAVIQTNKSGSCSVSASATNSNQLTSNFTSNNSPISSLSFLSAAPETIYQNNSPGATQSTVVFQLKDTTGAAVAQQDIDGSLTVTDGGVTFCGAGTAQTLKTDASGNVTFQVCAGTLPTTLAVRAALKSNPTIFTQSNKLTVQTGLPTQRFFDLSVSKENFRAWNFSGDKIDVNVYLADRQGNPVPDGTAVTFVSEGGQLITSGNSSCVVKDGGCKVQLIGQDYRPVGMVGGACKSLRPGRVTILAMVNGEESFVDANDNNRYDFGEKFEDMGIPFLDKNETRLFEASYQNYIINKNQPVTTSEDGEVMYPLPTSVTAGNVACSQSVVGPSVANSCNGVWDGFTKLRRDYVVVFSGDEIAQPGAYDATIPSVSRTQVLLDLAGVMLDGRAGKVEVRLADRNGNPLPAGSAVSVSDVSKKIGCEVTQTGNTVYPNTTEPAKFSATVKGCSGADILFEATVGDIKSSYTVQVP